MTGFGAGVVIVIATMAFLVCLIPLIVVASIRRTRKNGLAWVLASVPTAFLVATVISLKSGVDRDSRLIHAAEVGDRETVAQLLDTGVSPDAADMEGREAIWAATRGEHWDVVKLLIDRGRTTPTLGDDMNERDSIAFALEESGHTEFAPT